MGNRRLYRRALERFGDEERRLWPFAGQQPFGESGDEDDWHRKFCQYVLDRIDPARSEEHTSELQSLMRISYAVFCLKKKNTMNKVRDNKMTSYMQSS